MLRLKAATKFKKDLKKFNHNRVIQDELEDVVKLLINEIKLPEKNRDHNLVGNYVGHRECHISPDVLMIYKKDFSNKILSLERIGSHSELF